MKLCWPTHPPPRAVWSPWLVWVHGPGAWGPCLKHKDLLKIHITMHSIPSLQLAEILGCIPNCPFLDGNTGIVENRAVLSPATAEPTFPDTFPSGRQVHCEPPLPPAGPVTSHSVFWTGHESDLVDLVVNVLIS